MNVDSDASRSGRRLPRSERGIKRRQFTVTLSSDEYATLRARAANTGESMSRILVRAATAEASTPFIDGARLDEFLPILTDLQNQVRGISGNLNQLAHWANTEHAFPEEAADLAKHVRRLLVEIEDALESVRA
ncbi:MAG: MobC family plasmid mobilization relaxosome protein [Schaalia hyovaginalis]|uniref:MobC family plasmid mobilization relaxosome protein n=1 Tax=Schaalia hyovaginalis TaxID=29316 RepID=UPI0026EA09AA|nr:MobC family plasmid mobilization relaxosome protein [Schaalia hyovaginalis]MCI7513473.1 MobC family plasmid mobilization relaxosome protein [Schaalia hyovaginalis]MDY3666345.1 MobC family plasmid mobilization relaxosome protein [Schaalia hyovaginalis]MDY4263136.1 MobC family plasmid mobilization relaxosome protein [Schaalia hyovaginalis]